MGNKNTTNSSFSFDLSLDRSSFRLSAKADIPSNGITVILGKSGSGKTTLLRCLAGLEEKASGEIQFGETAWLSPDTSLPTHLRCCGYVFQHAALFPHLDVQGNLEYARKRASASEFETNSVIELTGIRDLSERAVDTLSGGERQRVAIARTLLSNPKALLLDEPFASLDAQARQSLLSLVEQVAQQFNIPVLYVTHNISEAVQLADHIIVLDRGRITHSGNPSDIFSSLEVMSDLVDEPQSIIECECQAIDETDHIGTLSFSGGTLHIPNCSLTPGAKTRALIKARDISLALDPPQNVSILNRIECVVSSITEYDAATNLIILAADKQNFQALITRRSTRELSLKPGTQMHALVKAVSLLS